METYFRAVPAPLEQELAAPHIKSKDESRWRILIWSFMGLGIFLRLFHFFDNRSLWIDESYLSNSIIRLGFSDLALAALDYEQKAPIGYLWGSKLMVLMFGNGEMALRLVPLLGGLGALFLLMKVAKHYLRPLGVVIAVGLLALAPPLVFHAVEAKQYSTELFFTVLSLYFFTVFYGRQNASSLVGWGLCGAVILWFSYAAIFVLAGMAFAVCLHHLVKRDWQTFFRYFVPFTLWLVSFAVNYLFFTSRHSDSDWLVVWFGQREGFMPLIPTSFTELSWFILAPYRMLDYPLGILWNFNIFEPSNWLLPFKMSWLMFAFIGAGMVVSFKRNRLLFMVLLFPVLLTLVASGLKLYPFYERLLVFLAPLFILFLALGCQALVNYGRRYTKAAYLLPAFLLFSPVFNSVAGIADPEVFGGRKFSTEREGLLYIQDHFQEGDLVYVFWNMEHAYRYYKESYNLQYDAIPGLDVKNQAQDKNNYYTLIQPDLDTISKGARVWVIHHRKLRLNIGDYDDTPAWYHIADDEPGDMLHEKVKSMGGEVQDSFITPDVAVHLYNLEQ